MMKVHFEVFSGLLVCATVFFLISGSAVAQTSTTIVNAGDGFSANLFGKSVAMSGDYMIVGAEDGIADSNFQGAAYIYHREGADWVEETKLTHSNGAAFDRFGTNVDIMSGVWGTVAVVGSPDHSAIASLQGAMVVYVPIMIGGFTFWNEVEVLHGFEQGDRHGWDVAVDEDLIAASSPDARDGIGRVIIYQRTSLTDWTLVQTLESNLPAGSDPFYGSSLDLHQGYVIIGAPRDDVNGLSNAGTVHIHHRDFGALGWGRQALLSASDASANANFGSSVAINGNYAMVGAPGTTTGSVYVFERAGDAWNEIAKINDSDMITGGEFGASLAMNGGWFIAGAPGLSLEPANNRAYVFQQDENNNALWNELTAFMSDPLLPYTQYGSAAGISHNRVAIGMPATVGTHPQGGAVVTHTYPVTAKSAVQFKLQPRQLTQGNEGTVKMRFTNNTSEDLTVLRRIVLVWPDGTEEDIAGIDSLTLLANRRTKVQLPVNIPLDYAAGNYTVRILWDDGAPYQVSSTLTVLSAVPQDIIYKGIVQNPLGDAELSIVGNTLEVGNIGSSGLDGFSAELGEVEGWTLSTADLVPGVGWCETIDVYGRLDGLNDQLLTQMSTVYSADWGQLICAVDYSPLGDNFQTINIYAEDDLVFSTASTSPVIHFDSSVRIITPFCLDNGTGVSEIEFEEPLEFYLPETNSYVWGDRIVFIPTFTTPPVEYLSQADVTIKNSPDYTLLGQGLKIFGNLHKGLSVSEFIAAAGQLTVVQPDLGQENGVLVILDDLNSFSASLIPLRMDATRHELTVNARGTVNSIDGVIIGTSSLAANSVSGYVDISADYPGLGVTDILVQVYDSGTWIGAVSAPAGIVGDLRNAGIDLVECGFDTDGETPGYFYRFYDAVTFEDLNGNQMAGNTIHLLPENSTAILSALAAFDMNFVEFPSFTITGETNDGVLITGPLAAANDGGMQLDGSIPRSTTLHQNYPNPFNPTTTIRYGLPVAGEVNLVVYDLLGQQVKQLAIGNRQSAGYHSATWDGRDDAGQQVASGLYIYRMSAGDFVQSLKMILLR